MAELVERREQRAWFVAFALCAILSAIPLLITFRLPMIDLPQHAAQTAILKQFDDGCYRFHELYALNWRTPYLLGTIISAALASFLGIPAALKLATFLAIVALPLSLRYAARYAGIDPWLALLGFPLAFGFSFYWGFLTFILTVPLVIVAIVQIYRSATDEKPSKPLVIAGLSLATALCHALAYCVLLAIAAPVALGLATRNRRSLMSFAALLPPVPFLAWWILEQRSTAIRASAPWDWDAGFMRVPRLFDHLLSPGGDGQGQLVALIVVLVVAISGVRFSRDWTRWVGLAVALSLVLVAPMAAFGQTFLYPRFGIFAFAALFIALDRGRPLLGRALIRGLVLFIAAMWLVVLTARFRAFHADADGFDQLVDIMPANQRVLLLNVVPGTTAVHGPMFVHFSGYYQERKGGVIGWSFASNFPPVVRYRKGTTEGVPPIVTHDPRYFQWDKHGNYRFFVLRAPMNMQPLVFKDHEQEVRLIARRGMWWLYERRNAGMRPDCVPLYPDRQHAPFL